MGDKESSQYSELCRFVTDSGTQCTNQRARFTVFCKEHRSLILKVPVVIAVIWSILVIPLGWVCNDYYAREISPQVFERFVPSKIEIRGLQIVTEIRGADSSFCNSTVVAHNNTGTVDPRLWDRFYPAIHRDSVLAADVSITASIRLYAIVTPGDSWRSGEVRAQVLWPRAAFDEQTIRTFSSAESCGRAVNLKLPDGSLVPVIKDARSKYLPVTDFDAGTQLLLEAVLCGTDTTGYYPLEMNVARSNIGLDPNPQLDLHRAQIQLLFSYGAVAEEWVVIPSPDSFTSIASTTVTEDAALCVDGQTLITVVSVDLDTTIVFDHRARVYER